MEKFVISEDMQKGSIDAANTIPISTSGADAETSIEEAFTPTTGNKEQVSRENQICKGTNTPSDAGRPATEEEIKTLRHVTDQIPLRVWLVAVISAAERFTYWSTQVTWQNYIQYGPDDDIPGVLGLGQATGVTINNAFNVVVYVLPIIIGPIADG